MIADLVGWLLLAIVLPWVKGMRDVFVGRRTRCARLLHRTMRWTTGN